MNFDKDLENYTINDDELKFGLIFCEITAVFYTLYLKIII